MAIVDAPRHAALLEGHPALAIVFPPGVPSGEQDEQVVLARRMVRIHDFGHAAKGAAGLRRKGRPVLVISHPAEIAAAPTSCPRQAEHAPATGTSWDR